MAAHQASLSLGLSRQEYWSGLPFPSPMHESEKWKWSRSVMSDSWRPHGLPSSNSLFCQLPASINHKSDLFFHEFVFEVWEDIQHYDSFLEKAMAPHSSTLAWKIPWVEEPGGLQSMGLLRVRQDWVTSLSLACIGEGNGNPLQCSCLENPRDRGACWAAVCGVAQSRTRLMQLSSSSMIVLGAQHSDLIFLYITKWSPP